MGRLLILVGLVFLLAGGVLLLAPKVPWLGRLPGDIHVKRGNFELHVPLATCFLFSILVSGVLWLIGRLRGR